MRRLRFVIAGFLVFSPGAGYATNPGNTVAQEVGDVVLRKLDSDRMGSGLET